MAVTDSELIDQIVAGTAAPYDPRQQAAASRAGAPPAVQVRQPIAGPPVPPPQAVLPPPDTAAAGGSILEKILGLLDMPSNVTQTGLGNLGAMALGGPGGREGFRQGRDAMSGQIQDTARDPGSNPMLTALMRSNPIMGALMSVPGVGGELSSTAFNVGSELATDPLNYVGMGIPAKLTELAQARNMSPAVMKMLSALARTEEGVQGALNLPGKVVGGVAKGAAKITPSFGRQVIEETPMGALARPSDNLYDYLSNTSRESFMRTRGRRMVDAYHYLKTKGVDLQEIYGSQKRKDATYRDVFRSGEELDNVEREIIERATSVGDVRAQVAGLDAIAYGHKVVADQWDQLALQFKTAKDGGMAHADLLELGKQLDATGFDESMRVWYAVDDTISHSARQASSRFPDVDPSVIGPVQHGVQSAKGYLNAQMDKLPTFNWSGVGPTQVDPYLMLKNMQTRGEKFTGDIGNLTGRLRQQIQGSNSVPFMNSDEAVRGVESRLQMASSKSPQRPGFLSLIPQELRQGMDVEWRNFNNKYRTLVNARNSVERAVKETWENQMGAVPMPAIDQNKPLESISQILTQAGVITRPLTSTTDLVQNLSLVGKANSGAIMAVDRAIKSFPAGDLLTADPFELVIDRVIREMGGTLGLKDGNKMSRILGDVTAFYKEQALLSGSYPLTNLTGGLFMGALKGVNPMRVLRNANGNMKRAWRGDTVQTQSARNFEETYGQSLGEATRQSSGVLESNSTRDYTRRGITASARIGAPALAAGGAALGGVSGAMSSPADATPGERAGNIARGAAEFGAAGAVMPWVSRQVLQRLGGGIETVMRETAAAQGATQYLHQEAWNLPVIARRALDLGREGTGPSLGLTPSRSGLSARVTQVGPSSGNRANALAEVQTRADNGGAMSPNELFDLLHKAGAAPPAARRAADQWREVVNKGVQHGTDFSNSIHFDYQNLNNLEQFMKTVLPFSTWAAKAIPFFAEEMAQHPVILQSMLDINAESERARESKGVTNRFSGALPANWAEGLFSAIIGRGTTPWFDPTKGLMPFSGAARQFGSGNEDDPLPAQILNKASAFGPGLHPLIEAGMRTATPDLLGSDEPAGSYLRWGRPIQAVDAALGGNRGRGIDANAALQSGETLLRRSGGQDPTNLTTSAALRRIDEMALEATGKNVRSGDPTVGAYLTAKTQQRGPLWDQAMREVQREKGTQSALGFGFGMASPQAMLGETEETIRGSRKNLLVTPELSAQLRALNEQQPGTLAPPELISQVRDAARQMTDQVSGPGSPMPPSIDMMLNGAPTISNLATITQQITTRQQYMNQEMGGYQGGGSPLEQKLDALIAEYNNVGSQTAGMSPTAATNVAELARQYTHPALAARGPNSYDAVQLKQLNMRKQAFRATNPLLDQYLNYLGLGGERSQQDFLQNYYGKQAVPPPAP